MQPDEKSAAQSNENNYAVLPKITARRPSGNQAMIAVDLHGKLKFKLDRYEGMTCLKDKGNTAQLPANAFVVRLLAYFPSYCTNFA